MDGGGEGVAKGVMDCVFLFFFLCEGGEIIKVFGAGRDTCEEDGVGGCRVHVGVGELALDRENG